MNHRRAIIAVLSFCCATSAGAQVFNTRAAADYSAANNGDAVLVMQNGQIIFEEYQNGYNQALPHLLASGTKSFNCAIAVKAQEENLVDLDEPVANVIHKWRTSSSSPSPQVDWKSNITARQLLSLSSGLASDGQDGVLQPVVDTYQQAILDRSSFAPGQVFIYTSNTFQAWSAYFQLKTGGTLAQDGTVNGGVDPYAYLTQKIFQPLGITATVTHDIAGHPQMAGGVFMKARDWLRFGQMISQGGTWNGTRILDQNKLRECITYNNPALASYGLSFWNNRSMATTLQLGTDEIPPGVIVNGTAQIMPDAPLDTFMAAGAMNQRLYIIPSLSLVVLRFGDGGDWSDNEFLKRLLNGNKPVVPAVQYQDMWWAGLAENGWGMSITQHGEALFGALYVYDSAGKPRWYVLPGGRWNANFSEFTGDLYQPTGSPYANYDTSRFVPGGGVGSATLTFRDGNAATLRYTIGGISGSKSIKRQSFADGDASASLTDLWWGGASQNGWGISLTQQGNQVFGVWYTYDDQGKTTWFVMPGGTFSGDQFNGALYSTIGSPWLGSDYDVSKFAVAVAGSLSLAFNSARTAATMSYSANGISGSKAIERQPF
ncbi:MAG: serine hydrolase [Betaproteobacteria bacterium]